jgi:hypothetical protein
MVLAEVKAGDTVGVGYTYGSRAIAPLAHHLVESCLLRQSPMDVARLNASMLRGAQ